MTTFVLVHGSFHGGWCWERVASRLRDRGHCVFTPTLTGLGERSHLAHPHVGLSTNVADVVNVLEFEDLSECILVGHSYAGMVITGVAEECPDRLIRLVYLDGFLPDDGESSWDILGGSSWEDRAREEGFGWLVPPVDPRRYGIEDPADLEWLREKMVPTPLLTHEERLDAPEERAKELPRAFITCLENDTFRQMAEKAKREGLDFYELETGHDAMISAPEELTDILLDVDRETD